MCKVCMVGRWHHQHCNNDLMLFTVVFALLFGDGSAVSNYSGLFRLL